MNVRAGEPAAESDLVSIPDLLDDYHDIVPDSSDPAQRVSFGTSGHRGSSSAGSFNEAHITAITAAIVEYRREQGYTGPLYLARDTHALSEPALLTTLEVLAAAEVPTMIDERDGYTPTPVLSHAILKHNASRGSTQGLADGIVITPSHNPPSDGGFKYNPPHGGPAGSSVTAWIENRANELLEAGWERIPRQAFQRAFHLDETLNFDFTSSYVDDLEKVIDVTAIRDSGLHIGADPMGGAAADYWPIIADRLDLNIDVVNAEVDPTWSFMTLDWDGKIRMDCSSPHAMASLIGNRNRFDIATGNDADADRHGIVTPDAGLMNPNHYLAAAVDYLFTHRPDWPKRAKIGKTAVTSGIIDRIAAARGRELYEVPVGFKYFVSGLLDGSVGFGGEESAGASFLAFDGSAWTTDKDGMLLCLLAAEMTAVTGKTPSQLYAGLVAEHGESAYARIDAPATREQKAALKELSPSQVSADTLAGEPITAKLTEAPGDGEALGGLKVTTESAWFAARPSGTEDVYKIYAESFRGPDHLAEVQAEAKAVVDGVIGEGS
ncbi:phosphoglucomutase (alpha-D-glucose-1,6-bisphosphate-dependent) [Brevibacterium luteolum]|uniref:phosphoglucomutase (alpha-D-glucose-1,6-bisphosphate-dependent) n=1 Tax=Brevibacterium luteolum TaxID=199591 RepID=UPI0021AE5E8F|nr:phosphoglucomutase (alpha-D-glucose-1,6-bisphosphate-dependent) [Brevibacterium luteolum]MCT1829681.1 phosphoglucomutase (alpha-D-glucose-1,6-bisphosphate-dependent) [Brevibacterium luteolum]MCT1873437.1 phosphoglucomutase (alpha-D-glucose-1,6-bisphosphate-dependent) [Brevibacterium luteolum]MCT1890053.1 phosphoglucomutase (alpha-D-glucose-1,6-bisphosphate-dependent) [Brevibacterium luteolum]MCT1892502.1 phosphoglucomutase (alpha-D-glucose-1,6-bisphosphate-dependent) [Brevibacterium luteolum